MEHPASLAGKEAIEALGRVQNELAVHNSASRAILTHLCQRLSRLETAVHALQTDMAQFRTDSQKDTNDVRGEFIGVQAKVESMSSQLHEYASVMDLFQSEISNQKSNLSWLSSSLTDEHGRVDEMHEVRQLFLVFVCPFSFVFVCADTLRALSFRKWIISEMILIVGSQS